MTFKFLSSRAVISFVLLSALVCIVTIVTLNHNGISKNDLQTADWVAAHGVATRADYLKTVYLRDKIVEDHNHPLTEQDVDWLLAFADNEHFQGRNRALRQVYAAGVLKFADTKHLPKTRLNKVYVFGISLLHTPDEAETYNSWAGCRILGNLGNRSAIPEIQPLLRSKNTATRRFAALALDNLGVEVPTSAWTSHTY